MASSSIAIPQQPTSLDWRKMNKQQLRDALASRGLDTEGLRPLLIQRLESSSKTPESGADVNANAVLEGTFETREEETNPQEKQGNEALEIDPKGKTAASGSALKASPPTQDATEKQELHAGNGSTGSLTDFERKQRRAERFGVDLQVSEEEKRRLRAARFGVAHGTSKVTVDKSTEIEKRKQRAMRFGMVDDDSRKKAREDDSAESEKRKARAERFGQAPEDSEIKPHKN